MRRRRKRWRPNDPSSARLLARAFRAAGKLADAEEVLVMAMALKSENDVLTAELRNDLAEVRRLLATLDRNRIQPGRLAIMPGKSGGK